MEQDINKSEIEIANGDYRVSYCNWNNYFDVMRYDDSGKILAKKQIKVGENIPRPIGKKLADGSCQLYPIYQRRTEINQIQFISRRKLEVEIRKVFGIDEGPIEKKYYDLENELPEEKQENRDNWFVRKFLSDIPFFGEK